MSSEISPDGTGSEDKDIDGVRDMYKSLLEKMQVKCVNLEADKGHLLKTHNEEIKRLNQTHDEEMEKKKKQIKQQNDDHQSLVRQLKEQYEKGVEEAKNKITSLEKALSEKKEEIKNMTIDHSDTKKTENTDKARENNADTERLPNKEKEGLQKEIDEEREKVRKLKSERQQQKQERDEKVQKLEEEQTRLLLKKEDECTRATADLRSELKDKVDEIADISEKLQACQTHIKELESSKKEFVEGSATTDMNFQKKEAEIQHKHRQEKDELRKKHRKEIQKLCQQISSLKENESEYKRKFAEDEERHEAALQSMREEVQKEMAAAYEAKREEVVLEYQKVVGNIDVAIEQLQCSLTEKDAEIKHLKTTLESDGHKVGQLIEHERRKWEKKMEVATNNMIRECRAREEKFHEEIDGLKSTAHQKDLDHIDKINKLKENHREEIQLKMVQFGNERKLIKESNLKKEAQMRQKCEELVEIKEKEIIALHREMREKDTQFRDESEKLKEKQENALADRDAAHKLEYELLMEAERCEKQKIWDQNSQALAQEREYVKELQSRLLEIEKEHKNDMETLQSQHRDELRKLTENVGSHDAEHQAILDDRQQKHEEEVRGLEEDNQGLQDKLRGTDVKLEEMTRSIEELEKQKAELTTKLTYGMVIEGYSGNGAVAERLLTSLMNSGEHTRGLLEEKERAWRETTEKLRQEHLSEVKEREAKWEAEKGRMEKKHEESIQKIDEEYTSFCWNLQIEKQTIEDKLEQREQTFNDKIEQLQRCHQNDLEKKDSQTMIRIQQTIDEYKERIKQLEQQQMIALSERDVTIQKMKNKIAKMEEEAREGIVRAESQHSQELLQLKEKYKGKINEIIRTSEAEKERKENECLESVNRMLEECKILQDRIEEKDTEHEEEVHELLEKSKHELRLALGEQEGLHEERVREFNVLKGKLEEEIETLKREAIDRRIEYEKLLKTLETQNQDVCLLKHRHKVELLHAQIMHEREMQKVGENSRAVEEDCLQQVSKLLQARDTEILRLTKLIDSTKRSSDLEIERLKTEYHDKLETRENCARQMWQKELSEIKCSYEENLKDKATDIQRLRQDLDEEKSNAKKTIMDLEAAHKEKNAKDTERLTTKLEAEKRAIVDIKLKADKEIQVLQKDNEEASRQIRQTTEELTKVNESLKENIESNKTLKAQMVTTESEINTWKLKTEECNQKISAYERQISSLKASCEELQYELAQKKQKKSRNIFSNRMSKRKFPLRGRGLFNQDPCETPGADASSDSTTSPLMPQFVTNI